MYENLYSYDETINEKSVWILFKPNFREAITLYDGNNKILSDGEVRILDSRHSKYLDVYISEDAQWGLEYEGNFYKLYVTERTEEISTPLGPEWNKEFNRLLKKCKGDYYQKKKEEIRLYFYEAAKDKLCLCYLGDYSGYDYYKYSLNRYFSPYCAIDKRYAKPEKDSFILGRVRKTIGLKNSKLLDFIEPVYEVPLDFEKDKWDFGDYKENLDELEKNIYDLLKFSIAKEYNNLYEMRIRAYFKDYSSTQKSIIFKFKGEIRNAFKEGNVAKARALYNVLNTPQDCTNVSFKLRLKEEVECSSDKNFEVFFVNGERGYVSAKWVYENIHNCTDARGVYLGDMRNRYNFY